MQRAFFMCVVGMTHRDGGNMDGTESRWSKFRDKSGIWPINKARYN